MRIRFAVFVVSLARIAGAQTADTSPATRTTVSGIVHDSLAGRPLANATVQLVDHANIASAARTTTTDSLGRYALDGVAAGRYTLGFFHPILDSLGVEAPMRPVVVDGREPVRGDLAVPSARRFRSTVCGAPNGADIEGGIVIGVLRNPVDGAPLAGGTVTGEWLEYAFTHQGIQRRAPRVSAKTSESGWFAICGTPRGGTMLLHATRGADSTDRVEITVPADGFLRRELYVTAAHAPATDTLRARGVRLSGTVTATAGGRPLSGAFVAIAGGPSAQANAQGEWAIPDAPLGTRTLEVRAIGYYPVRRAIDVVNGAVPLHIALATLRSVLDTVRVSAQQRKFTNTGFTERRRTGAGRYFTAAEIAKRNPLTVSELFRVLPGVTIERVPGDTERRVVMSRLGSQCGPSFYVNGHYMGTLNADEIDALMNPHEVAGIEIYTEQTAPVQFRPIVSALGYEESVFDAQNAQPGDRPSMRDHDETGTCGSVVMWTK